ncbi:hypothetical protein JW992_16805 [candidate division KSB1 bacterium]|nr:hypothetical protein [candidate division KSB1 bacterium]
MKTLHVEDETHRLLAVLAAMRGEQISVLGDRLLREALKVGNLNRAFQEANTDPENYKKG